MGEWDDKYALLSATRPFLFALRDDRTGLILFMGRCVAPPRP